LDKVGFGKLNLAVTDPVGKTQFGSVPKLVKENRNIAVFPTQRLDTELVPVPSRTTIPEVEKSHCAFTLVTIKSDSTKVNSVNLISNFCVGVLKIVLKKINSELIN
jgi:hypothetical protein